MKSVLPAIFISLLALYFIPLYPVFAEENRPQENKPVTALEKIKMRQQETVLKNTSQEARIKLRNDQIASKSAQLKAKIAAFRDQKKAVAAERISENLNKINQKRVEQMSKRISGMSEILNKVEQISATASNSASSSAAIADAKSAIETAQAKVTAQGEKDYTLTIRTENTVKTDATNIKQTLLADLKITEDSVRAAKEALVKAIRITARTVRGATSGE